MYASFSCLKDTWCKRIDKMFLTFLLKLEFLHGRVKQNQWWLLAGISKFHQRNNCCKGPAAAAWCGKLQGLIRHLRRKFSLNEIQREREREREREKDKRMFANSLAWKKLLLLGKLWERRACPRVTFAVYFLWDELLTNRFVDVSVLSSRSAKLAYPYV